MNVSSRTCASRKSETAVRSRVHNGLPARGNFCRLGRSQAALPHATSSDACALRHSDATLFGGVLAHVKSRVDFFAKNTLRPSGRGSRNFKRKAIACSKSERVARCCSAFRRDFPPKPPGRFESAAASAIGKFHLGNYKTGMSAPINIQLDQQIFPRNFVAHFPQSSPSRTGPERRELLLAQFDLAFFAMAPPTDLKCQRRSLVCFSRRTVCLRIPWPDNLAR